GALHDCDISGEPRICVPHAWCKNDGNVAFDEKCTTAPYGIAPFCCLMSNLLVRVVDEESETIIDTTEETLAYHMCNEYYRPVNAIADGDRGLIREFPFLYVLGWKENYTIRYSCVGTLISARYLLASTSCWDGRLGLPSVVRAAGISFTDPRVENIEIVECIKHPDHKDNYIALLKLADYRVPSSRFEGAACLWTVPYIENDADVIVLGYRQTSFAGTFSEDFLKTTLKAQSQYRCEQYYSPKYQVFYDRKTGTSKNILCAIDPDNLGSACERDTGGPLIAIIEEKPFVVGLSVGCLFDKPIIYPMIIEYISWIEKIVWPDYY
uniref:Peptidase S1 domain-containing protein n=1 Tax=Glossina morsitans morsitans TaxID=37546 RepID=A0A1B0G6L9_GLOMM